MYIGTAIVQLVLTLSGEPEPRLFQPGKVGHADGATPAEIERHRIQRHLALVEATLRAETPTDLTEDRALARAALLDELHAYAQRGIFPRNDDFPDRRMPVFIDDLGTACAVGHLMIASGAGDMAHAIARDEKFDYVAEIDHPGVGAWLDSQGLTAAEAAWIQPSYGPCGFDGELVCGVDGNTYLCEYIATECAMVEVAYVGACDTETGGDEFIGEEICMGTDDTTSADGGDTTDGSTDAGSTDDDTTGDPGSRGCSATAPTQAGGFGLLMLVLVATRRRSPTR